MSKVKLTKRQAEDLGRLENLWEDVDEKDRNYILIEEKLDPDYKWGNHADEIDDKDFIAALHYGFEVEPEFKAGDWVYHTDGLVGKVLNINEYGLMMTDIEFEPDVYIQTYAKHFRIATPSEIAREESRRWWDKLNRGVDEYRRVDVVIYAHDSGLYEVVDVYDTKNVEITNSFGDTTMTVTVDKLKLVSRAEDRVDVCTGE